ncbi:M14 family metallopeptidase [Rubrivivax rivuli]|uniref:Carboxypeptidase n=1 Tax=Rubrivivax rivuli TaxID=1862385 RepID=A0A437RSE0_9BURK|nr:M14 family metallopeptidase [Rubrivivax rivuli]RVU49650.1 carboxypeptidase [Rubrivivax rivuli]
MHTFLPRLSALGLAVGLAFGLALPAQAQSRTATPAGDDIYQQLEAEKGVYNVYKAYFPSRDIARRAAVTFHAQLLESDYAGGFLVMQLDEREMRQLQRFGFRFERATEFIERRNRALTEFQIERTRRIAGQPEPLSIPGYACYETVEETFSAADGLIAAQPTLASWVTAGSSWLKTQGQGGYDIKVLKLTNSAVAAPAGTAKPRLFLTSAIHAREYTTAPLVLEFARWLVNGYGVNADATWILDHHEVHLLFHTNPDGRKRAETGLSWRKNVNNNFCANTNTRGVDLNRNFSFEWNSTAGQGSSGSACSLTYRGPSAGSEPETQAVQNYARSLWPDRRGPGVNDPAPADTSGIHIDIHSFSELVLWPWGATASPAPNGPALQTLGRRFAWFNGYQPTQSIGLYPTDGTSDGPSYGELGVAAFTFELGTAFFQSCSVYESTVKPGNLPALIYAAKVVRTPYVTPGGPEVTALALEGNASGSGVAAGTAVALSASATDARFNQTNGTEATQAVSAAEYTIDTPPWEAAAVPRVLQAADGSFNSATEALAGSISTAGLAPGRHTVFVRARDASGIWGPVSAVFLNVTPAVVTQLPEVESNGRPALAQTVSVFPSLVNATMDTPERSERSDTDFFRIELGAGKTLTAVMTPNAGGDYNVELLNSAGQRLAANFLGTGQVETVSYSNTGAASMTVYVRVGYGSGGKGPVDGRYTLALSQ